MTNLNNVDIDGRSRHHPKMNLNFTITTPLGTLSLIYNDFYNYDARRSGEVKLDHKIKPFDQNKKSKEKVLY